MMIGLSIYHVAFLVKSRRGRRELAEMFPNPLVDGKHALENIKFILGMRETAPAGRRYTYKEKAEYWALVWGTFVMAVTGIILWSASSWNWVVVEVSRIVHSYEAILAFGAIVIWHLFTVQFRPGIWPTSPTWMDGTATVHTMKEEHAQEYAEMVAWHGVDPDEDAHSDHRTPKGTH
jgi:cytochrome b subunit of formate dehydrogenase